LPSPWRSPCQLVVPLFWGWQPPTNHFPWWIAWRNSLA
jgi:hypothetical protein